MLWPNGRARDVWMIVDAARDRRIFGRILDCCYSDHTCLFSGPLAPELEISAPYLICVDYDSPKVQRLVADAWHNEWALFLKCGLGLTDLRRHLRELLLVRHPNGSPMLFRYYDPRVLKRYLPTCTSDELRAVFGGIECFWFEGDEGGGALAASLEDQRLVLRNFPFSE